MKNSNNTTDAIVQVNVELEETKEKCEGLQSDLSSVTADLETRLASIAEKEEELQILRSCLSQVTEEAAAAATSDDVTDGGVSPSSGELEEVVKGGQEREDAGDKKPVQLEKIQAMLNTTKVRCMPRNSCRIFYSGYVGKGWEWLVLETSILTSC